MGLCPYPKLKAAPSCGDTFGLGMHGVVSVYPREVVKSVKRDHAAGAA